MSPLFETIKIKDGKIYNLPFHQDRVNRAFDEVFGVNPKLQKGNVMNLESLLFPLPIGPGTFRCRIDYDQHGSKTEFYPYQAREITSLQMIELEGYQYGHKFRDRSGLNRLFERRDQSDDILLIQDGYITDTSYSNVAFFDGSSWFTSSRYLLRGTKRESLLKLGVLQEKVIRVEDLTSFQKLSLINSMLDLGEITLAIHQINFI